MNGDKLISKIIEMFNDEKIRCYDSNIVIRLRQLSELELERLIMDN